MADKQILLRESKKVEILLGHFNVLHKTASVVFPWHILPPYFGTGLLHHLSLLLRPELQGLSQWYHSVQSDQPPLTKRKGMKYSLAKSLVINKLYVVVIDNVFQLKMICKLGGSAKRSVNRAAKCINTKT